MSKISDKPFIGQAGNRRINKANENARAAPFGPDRGKGLVSEAQGLEVEQQAMLESATLDQSYQETLAMHVLAKQGQVESIEGRLENLIDRQQARLQQTQANRPGLMSLPGARNEWQVSQGRQQARLQTLHTRLDTVREIKEGMGLHSPRIEELATRKMRADNPELSADWDAMKQAQRQHQALQKKQEQEKKLKQENSRGLSLGLTKPLQ